MYHVVSDRRKGTPGYYVEDDEAGETKGEFDCEKWAEEFAKELNNLSDQRLQRKRRRPGTLLP